MDLSLPDATAASDVVAPAPSEAEAAATPKNEPVTEPIVADARSAVAEESASKVDISDPASSPPILTEAQAPDSTYSSKAASADKQASDSTPGASMRAQSFWRRIDGFQAAGVAVALGVGWIIGANTLADRPNTAQLQAELGALGAKVTAVETLSAQAARVSEIKSLQKSELGLSAAVRAQKIRLEESDRRAQARFALTAARLDHLEKDNRLTQISARLSRLEHQLSSRQPTASIGPPVSKRAQAAKTPYAAPTPGAAAKRAKEGDVASPVRPLAREEDRQGARDAAIPASGYVLRDVYRGVALIETRSGLKVIAPGDRLPGAGRVIRIEKNGGGWVVVTSNGIIDESAY